MSWGNATPLEILWTVIAAAGVLGCLWLVREAWLDVQQARHLDPITTLLGVTSIVIVILVSISLLILSLIGVRAMELPPPANTPDPSTVLVSLGFIVLGLCQIGIVITKTWQRIEARRIYHRERGRGETS